MRKIDSLASMAFAANKPMSCGNTRVIPSESGAQLLLHGNQIAWMDGDTLVIDTCGWDTATTRARLNSLPNVVIRRKGGQLYLNGVAWDGNATTVISGG